MGLCVLEQWQGIFLKNIMARKTSKTDSDSNKPAPFTDGDGLSDLTASGEPVVSRLGTPDQALTFCNSVVRNDVIRDRRRVRNQGIIDGNPPFPPAALAAAGRGTESNINWRDAKGYITNAWTPYFDLTTEVPICIDGDLEFAGSDIDVELMRGFAEAFHRMVFQWESFDYMTQLRDLQMLVHGPGVVCWDDTWGVDWRPVPVLTSNAYVSDVATVDMKNFPFFMTTTPIEAGELYHIIEDEQKAEAPGWNVKCVKDCIMLSARSDSYLIGQKWDRWQQAFKNGDLYVSQTQTKTIQLYHTWTMEMDGKISRHILQVGGSPSSEGRAGSDYLFQKTDMADEWNQVLCPFFYDIGSDGTWHSVKGLGTEIAPYCEFLNRVNNSTADLILTSIKPMFQATTGGDLQNMQMMVLGGHNIVPSGWNLLQQNSGNAIQPALEVSQAFRNTLSRNTGSFYEDAAPPTVEETAKAVSIRAMDRAKLTKGAHNRHYRSMDRMYREMWRRAVNPKLKEYMPGAKQALAFQAECYAICDEFEVPHSALQAVQNVRACRAIGLGSPAMRALISEDLMRQWPLLDEAGKNELLRMYFASRIGWYALDALVPSLSKPRLTNEQDQIAILENGALNVGGEAVVTPKDSHSIHLKHHVGSSEMDQAAVEDGSLDPKEGFMRIEEKMPHSLEHLNFLAQNPLRKKEVDDYSERIKNLSSFADKLKQNLDEQGALEPPQQAPDPEMAKVQGQLQLKAQKQQGDMQLKEQKQAASFQLQIRQLQDKQVLEFAKLRAELGLKAHETAANVQMDDAETADSIHRKNAESKETVNAE